MPKKCQYCGEEIKNEQAKFCSNCGCSFIDILKIMQDVKSQSEKLQSKEIPANDDDIPEEEKKEAIFEQVFQNFIDSANNPSSTRITEVKDEDALKYAEELIDSQKNELMAMNKLLSQNHPLLTRRKREELTKWKNILEDVHNKQKIEVLKYRAVEKSKHLYQAFYWGESLDKDPVLTMLVFKDGGLEEIKREYDVLVEEAKILDVDLNSDEVLKQTAKDLQGLIRTSENVRKRKAESDKKVDKQTNPEKITTKEVKSNETDDNKIDNNDNIPSESSATPIQQNVIQQEEVVVSTQPENQEEKKEDKPSRNAAISIVLTGIIYYFDILPISGGGFLSSVVGCVIVYLVIGVILHYIYPEKD